MTEGDRRILRFDLARAAAAVAPPLIHWMIEEKDPRLGIPTGRLACNPPEAGELLTGGAWSTQAGNVTCSACLRKFFSGRAHKTHKPTTD